MSYSPPLAALEAICDVFDAVGIDQLSSPLQSTRYRLHRALEQTGSVPLDKLCEDLADSLADVTAEARLMVEDPFSPAGVALTPSPSLDLHSDQRSHVA
jgi:hypothetical protein